MTAQIRISDVLLDNGREHVLLDDEPLMAAWTENERPLFRAWRPDCARGYKATWAIKQGRRCEYWLYLTSVFACVESSHVAVKAAQGELCFPDCPDESLYKLFPNCKGPVRARFFSGEIRTAYSFIPAEARMPRTGPIDMVFRVEAGRVVHILDYGHELRY